jgi:hypothetical protein
MRAASHFRIVAIPDCGLEHPEDACPPSAIRHRIMTEIDSPPVRAPEFPANLDWIHTGGRRLTLADFRGKLLFLDFWTYG